jgi:hypothetical protein
MEKKMKEKKKVASDVAIFLLIWWEQFPLQRRDATCIDLLASPSTSAT